MVWLFVSTAFHTLSYFSVSSRVGCRTRSWRFWRWSRSQSSAPPSHPLCSDRHERLDESFFYFLIQIMIGSMNLDVNLYIVALFSWENNWGCWWGQFVNLCFSFCIFFCSAFNISELCMHRPVAAVWLTVDHGCFKCQRTKKTHKPTPSVCHLSSFLLLFVSFFS